jgi:hypothetical protein
MDRRPRPSGRQGRRSFSGRAPAAGEEVAYGGERVLREDGSVNDGPLSEPGTGVEPSAVPWPAGPHYFELTGSGGAVAWVRYRVWAADWYTRALREVAGPDGNYDRLVGIEMALDGALNSLSSAFDAATAVLIEGAENALHLADSDRLPVRDYSWSRLRKMLAGPKIGSNADGMTNDHVWRLVLDVDNALDGANDPVPTGWLASLRRLRNRVAHQDTLARHHDPSARSITVSAFGGRNGDAFEHLARACDQVHDLTEQMVSLAIYLGAAELHAGWPRPRWFPAAD